jgi:transcriptional regulator with XRE-family HTH domain
MARKTSALLASGALRLQRFGERLRFARLRRKLTAKQVAERAGMTVVTLRNLERGGTGVTMGAYLAVMHVLGIDEDLDLLAKDDPLGRKLQDAALVRKSVRKPRATSRTTGQTPPHKTEPERNSLVTPEPESAEWISGSDFVSARDLASLITNPAPSKHRKNK